jgi:DNA polymerase IIIc chi subunit
MSKCIFHDIDADRRDRRIFEIVEQAYQRREPVLIFVDTQERADAIDRTLWILKQEAFIPHKIFQQNEPVGGVSAAIVIAEINPISAQILIADGHCSLDFACIFSTIHEFVTRTTPQIHGACRDRFRSYRERQCTVEHLKNT